MRKYGLNSVETDGLEIKEDNETLTVPAVITREGVYDYDGMLIYEPASEVICQHLNLVRRFWITNPPITQARKEAIIPYRRPVT